MSETHYLLFLLGEMQRIAFRLMPSSYVYLCLSVCLCVCVCVCLCVYAVFMDLRKTVGDRDAVFVLDCSEWHRTKPKRVLHKSDYKFNDGGQNGGRETLYLAVTSPFINTENSFFPPNCAQWHRISVVEVWHKSDNKFQDVGQNGGCETL